MNQKAKSRSVKPPRDASKTEQERADNEGMSLKSSPDWENRMIGKAHSNAPPKAHPSPGQPPTEEKAGPRSAAARAAVSYR